MTNDVASRRAKRDVVAISLGAGLTWLASANIDVFERFIDWVHAHERWEVDELVTVGAFLAIALTVYILRRWREAVHLTRSLHETTAQLAAREEELTAVLRAIPDPMVRVDRTGRVVEARQDIFGPGAFGGITGRFVSDLMPAEQAALIVDAVGQVRATGATVEKSFVFPEWPGHEFWEARFVPVGDGDVLAVTRDFTSLRRHEQQVAEVSERFRAAFEGAAAGVAIIDARTQRLNLINRAGAEMLGRGQEYLIGSAVSELIVPEDLPLWTEGVRRLITGESSGGRLKLRFLRSNGAVVHGLVSVALVRTRDPETPELIAHVIDVTSQEQAQRQLMELLANKDEFIATVSHELRTPLTAVMGFAEILQQSPELDEEERDQMVAAIAEQSRDMSHMIEDLLVGARIDGETLTLLRSRVDLVSEGRQVVHSLRGMFEPVDVRSDAAATIVEGDPTRIRQILRNLITNAVRYGGRNITIRVHSDAGTASLTVMDDGPGVPSRENERIFDPYHRAHDTSGVTGSVGLGLTVSRRLARMMGGDVIYRRVDGLTVFELSLPEAEPALSEAPTTSESMARSN